MKDVFISYKNEEFDEANWVKTILETNGISCWMAPMCIPGGSSYAAEIPVAIRNCKVFVLILSERSQLSKWVPRELDQAINAGKTVLPFMLEDCPLKDDFNFYLTNVQRYAAYESKTKAIEKMLREIKAIIGAANVGADAEVKSDAVNSVEVAGGNALADDVKNESKVSDTAEKSEVEPKAEHVPTTNVEKVEAKVDTKVEAKVDTKAEAKIDAKVDEKPQPKRVVSETKKEVSVQSSAAKSGTVIDRKTAKKRLIAVVGVAIAIVLVIAGIIISKEINSVKIGGEKYYADASMVWLEDKTLSYGEVKSFEKLGELNSVYLKNCVLPDDIDGIFNAKYTVSLENCGIDDAKLKTVNFEDCTIGTLLLDGNSGITDIGYLAPLSDSVYNLSLNNCSVADISVLKDFKLLSTFSADGNKISDISPLGGCSALTSVSLNFNELTSLEVFSEYKLLETVKVCSNKLNSLSGLESSISLKVIEAADNSLTELDGLKNTTLLKTVDISRNNISDISVLSASSATLTKVYAQENNLSDISCLSNAVGITELFVDGNSLKDLSALSKMVSLKELSASKNAISDISGIFECTELTYLNLSQNGIVSTKELPEFKSDDIVLDLSRNNIVELSLPVSKYRRLDLMGNSIADLSDVVAASGSAVVFDYNDGIDFGAFSNKPFQKYSVLNCPLDRQVEISSVLGKHAVHFITEAEYFESLN